MAAFPSVIMFQFQNGAIKSFLELIEKFSSK